jgi:alpha-beta hydrolase superfamily lysophospholipase
VTGVERRPLYFGIEGRPLFGWLHLPPAHSATSIGLVICNAFGNEALCSHRSVRHFAERAAQQGIPTLRFDYDGTGDSAGHDLEPDRLAAWISSTRAAADEIRAATGVEHVCFAGIRLGATIAALAAVERSDVAGLIAIAPVLSGKAYVRELRLLTRAMEAKSNSAQADRPDLLQAAGFALSAATQESLLQIDLKRLAKPPAARVLVLDRTELPAGDAWPQHLRGLGARAERLAVTGYTEMMLDSHETVIPHEMIGTALGWLSQVASESSGTAARQRGENRPPWSARERAVIPPSASIDPVTGDTPSATVEESFVRIGPAPELFGIVSVPLSQRRDRAANGPAVLLLNAGAVYHVGPNRLYVALARHLARSGYVVLRIDIAGIGDSPVHEGEADNIVYSKFALDDLGKCIDYLRREWGVRDVRAVGLCSGAYHAFKASVAQLALTHAVMINPLTFFWKQGMSLEYPEHRIAADIVRYRTNMLRLSSWLKLFKGGVNLVELGHVLARRAGAVILTALRAPARQLGIPLQDDLPSELRTAARAPVQMHFVFAASDPGQELLRSQGGRTAQRMLARGQLKVELIQDADHTFTDLTARTTLAAALARILGAGRK